MHNDTHMHQWISPQRMSYVTGTWADAAGQVSHTIVKKRSAADAASAAGFTTNNSRNCVSGSTSWSR